jgi:hypothetical protein
MVKIQNLIKLNPGQNGKHSYFFILTDGGVKRDARVSLNILTKIKKALDHRELIGLPVTNMAEFLATFLPETFLVLLNRAGIGMVDAWDFMAKKAFPASASGTIKENPITRRNRAQAEKLARILATVEGGKISAKDISATLLHLIKNHLIPATEILQEWAQTYGYSRKGGYVIVGNRANRKAKKGSTKASVKAA